MRALHLLGRKGMARIFERLSLGARRMRTNSDVDAIVTEPGRKLQRAFHPTNFFFGRKAKIGASVPPKPGPVLFSRRFLAQI